MLRRRKMGFGLPVEHWLRGALKDLTWDLLDSQQARNRGVVDTQQVRQLLLDHQSRVQNHDRRIWAWLCFELWCRTYLDGADQPEFAFGKSGGAALAVSSAAGASTVAQP